MIDSVKSTAAVSSSRMQVGRKLGKNKSMQVIREGLKKMEFSIKAGWVGPRWTHFPLRKNQKKTWSKNT